MESYKLILKGAFRLKSAKIMESKKKEIIKQYDWDFESTYKSRRPSYFDGYGGFYISELKTKILHDKEIKKLIKNNVVIKKIIPKFKPETFWWWSDGKDNPRSLPKIYSKKDVIL